MRQVIWALALVVTGCIEPSSTVCNGRACPTGTTCEELVGTSGDPHLCVGADAVAACSGKSLLESCTYDGLTAEAACYETMQGSICLPSGCGNFLIDIGEVCDDGNADVGDGCSAACTSKEMCGNGVVDPLDVGEDGAFVLDEVCDDGNLGGHDGCTSVCSNEGPQWKHVDSTHPSGRTGLAMAYDPVRKRLVMFGGSVGPATGCFAIGDPLADTWESPDGNTWVEKTPTFGPGARNGHLMAYDGNTNRVILFGGDAGFRRNDTWAWDGDVWTQLMPATSPPARADSAMVYDSRRKRVVLFGGGLSMGVANDTWEWDGVTWTQVTTATTPHARSRHSMAYDPYRGVTVLVGGYLNNANGTVDPPDTWQYDGVNWTQVATTTTPLGETLAFDPVNNAMVSYSEFYIPPNSYTSRRTYTWNGSVWTDTGNTAPGITLTAATMTTDPRGNAILFGGVVRTVTGGFPQSCTNTYKSDPWFWTGTTWTTSAAPSPKFRESPSAALDPVQHRIIVVGGRDPFSNDRFNDTWEFDGMKWTSGPGPWPDGAGRSRATMAYDVARKQLVLFAGEVDETGTNDTFVRTGSTWAEASPSMRPGPRDGHVMTYDAARGEVLVFGGYDSLGQTYVGDTWVWNGTTWAKRQPAHSPPPRYLAAIGYDPIAQRVVLFSGFTSGGGILEDTWVWDGTDWTDVSPAIHPPPRRASQMSWDPARRRLLLVGGSTGSAQFDDSWEWDGARWTEVQVTARLTKRRQHVTVPTLDGAGIYVMGGAAGTQNGPFDTWRLRWESTGVYEYCALPVDNDGDGQSGCADPDCWATCTPLCLPGLPCDAAAPRCGDQTCNAVVEDCRSCPQDCTTCTPAVCGDTFCEGSESSTTCRGDCP